MPDNNSTVQIYNIGNNKYTVISHFGNTKKSDLLLKLLKETPFADSYKNDEL